MKKFNINLKECNQELKECNQELKECNQEFKDCTKFKNGIKNWIYVIVRYKIEKLKSFPFFKKMENFQKDEECEKEIAEELAYESTLYNNFMKDLYEPYKLTDESLKEFTLRVEQYQRIFMMVGEYSEHLLIEALIKELDMRT